MEEAHFRNCGLQDRRTRACISACMYMHAYYMLHATYMHVLSHRMAHEAVRVIWVNALCLMISSELWETVVMFFFHTCMDSIQRMNLREIDFGNVKYGNLRADASPPHVARTGTHMGGAVGHPIWRMTWYVSLRACCISSVRLLSHSRCSACTAVARRWTRGT